MIDWAARTHAPLLAQRIPREDIEPGVAYRIHARNGGIGVAVLDQDRGMLGYRLRRTKWERVYLFTEWDWADSDDHGTAIPLERLADRPPQGEEELLAWLETQETRHEAQIRAAWDTVLGRGSGQGR